MAPHLQRAAAAGVLALAGALGSGCSTPRQGPCAIRSVEYNGWPCVELTNGRIDVVVAPRLGGRIIQLRLDGFEYLWVNRDLAGQVRSLPAAPGAPSDGLGSWANYGGDKLWPAPQGWSGPDQWPGPPDPWEKGGCTDGGAFVLERMAEGPGEVALRLTGPEDGYAGIRFIREIRVTAGAATVSLRSTMENTSGRPVRWGIWQVTQHAAPPIALAGGKGSAPDLMAWVPVNPASRFPAGYRVLFGPEDNSQFALATPFRDGPRLFRIDYSHKVGKAVLDSAAGWLAVTHEATGHLFVHTFQEEPGREHPDGATVEMWTSGPGRIQIGGSAVDLAATEPWLVETEVLSPFESLAPGQSASLVSAIHLGRGFGPVVRAGEGVAVLEPPVLGTAGLRGRFTVFRDGIVRLEAFPGRSAMDSILGRVRAGDLVDLGALGIADPGKGLPPDAAVIVADPGGIPLDRLPIGRP